MGKDIRVGQGVKIKTIGVTWGFMSEEKLKEYCPTVLCTQFSELEDAIKGI